MITSVNEWINCAGPYAEASSKDQNRHLRVWFRGQANERWLLRPKIFRQLRPDPSSSEISALWGHEAHMNREFQSWSANLTPSAKEPIDSYFLQQHYGVPTRFLDWTRNALVALYFATEVKGGDPEPNGKVFGVDAYKFPTVVVPWRENSITIQGFSTAIHPVFRPIVDQLYYWQEEIFAAPVFPVFPRFLDIRMQIQRAAFTYHSPQNPVLTSERNHTLREFIVCGKSKAEIRRQLTHLGVDEFFVYGDLSSLAKTIESNHPLDQ